ncbi:MAG: hypothetical protein ACFFCD_07200 [Promethearchaeota archaeon]
MASYMELQEERVICSFCNKPTASYFCLGCKSLFCENCAHIEVRDYNFCGECHSTDLRELKEKKDDQETLKVVCLNCKSSKIKKGKKRTQLCPACGKRNFENIVKFQRYLYTQYREFCKQLTIALDILSLFVKKIDWYRDLVLALREQGYYIYPFLEEKLLKVYLSFDAIKKKVLERESHYVSILRKYVLDFLNKKQISPYMFKKYMEKLETIELEYTLYRRGIDNLLENFPELFAELEASLNILDFYRERFEKWKDVLNLSLKELPLCNLPEVDCTGSSSSLLVKTGRGHLFFTNQRLIFVGKTGFVSKSPTKLFELPISKIVGCNLRKGLLSRKALLKTMNGTVKFSGNKKVLVTLVKYVDFLKGWKKHCVSENLTEDLRRCEISLSDIKRKIDGDVQGLLYSRYPQFSTMMKPRLRVRSERIETPTVIPRSKQNQALLKKIEELKREKYALLKTIAVLEAKFKAARIPKEFYLHEIRTLTGELYAIDTQLDKLNGHER